MGLQRQLDTLKIQVLFFFFLITPKPGVE